MTRLRFPCEQNEGKSSEMMRLPKYHPGLSEQAVSLAGPAITKDE